MTYNCPHKCQIVSTLLIALHYNASQKRKVLLKTIGVLKKRKVLVDKKERYMKMKTSKDGKKKELEAIL